MANSYGAVSITATATQIVDTKSFRRGILIVNNSSVTVYLGMDSNVTTVNGLPLLPQDRFENAGYLELWRGAMYGIVSTGTADIRFWQWEEV